MSKFCFFCILFLGAGTRSNFSLNVENLLFFHMWAIFSLNIIAQKHVKYLKQTANASFGLVFTFFNDQKPFSEKKNFLCVMERR